MAIVINGNGINMGNNPVSNASQIDGVVINENNENVATTSNLVGFKNYIINGNFDIWQRGTGPFTNYQYGADRWVCHHPTATMSSSTTSSNGVQKRIVHITNVTAGGGLLSQPIELPLKGFGHPFVVGKKFTVSVRYSSTTKIRPSLVFRDSGVGANPVNLDSSMAAPVYKGGSGVDEVVSWTFTVGGTAASTNTCLVLTLQSESNASHVYVYQVQLEEGSVVTPFEQRPIGLELSLCQRYYEIGGGTILCSSSTASMSGAVTVQEYKVTKRAMPTMTVSKDSGTIAGLSIGTSMHSLSVSPSSQASDGQYAYYTWTASAEL